MNFRSLTLSVVLLLLLQRCEFIRSAETGVETDVETGVETGVKVSRYELLSEMYRRVSQNDTGLFYESWRLFTRDEILAFPFLHQALYIDNLELTKTLVVELEADVDRFVDEETRIRPLHRTVWAENNGNVSTFMYIGQSGVKRYALTNLHHTYVVVLGEASN